SHLDPSRQLGSRPFGYSCVDFGLAGQKILPHQFAKPNARDKGASGPSSKPGTRKPCRCAPGVVPGEKGVTSLPSPEVPDPSKNMVVGQFPIIRLLGTWTKQRCTEVRTWRGPGCKDGLSSQQP